MPPKVMVNVSQCRELCAAATGGAALRRIGLMPHWPDAAWPSWASSRAAASAGTLEKAARPASHGAGRRLPAPSLHARSSILPMRSSILRGGRGHVKREGSSMSCHPATLCPAALMPRCSAVLHGAATWPKALCSRQGQRGQEAARPVFGPSPRVRRRPAGASRRRLPATPRRRLLPAAGRISPRQLRGFFGSPPRGRRHKRPLRKGSAQPLPGLCRPCPPGWPQGRLRDCSPASPDQRQPRAPGPGSGEARRAGGRQARRP